eukprot:599593-Alexandrium_andersonii.AAC.1
MGPRALRNPAAAVMVVAAAPRAIETYSRTARMAYSAVRHTAKQVVGVALHVHHGLQSMQLQQLHPQ